VNFRRQPSESVDSRQLPLLGRELLDTPELLELPERIVQFGTGAFLRGFVGHFIDRANRAGLAAGRIVAVASTESGREARLNEQDGLYTLAVQGIENGVACRRLELIAATSRALSAVSQWDEVLRLARSPDLELVFSNTTEVGIALDEGDTADSAPPRSFPGKLTRFLYERARTFDYDAQCGVVVLPCELIDDNGEVLKRIVLQLAERWKLPPQLAQWVEAAVPFCNTLVDRIVPGEPDAATREELFAELGYRDELLTACEVYRLFAIETPQKLRQLRFAQADASVIIADDIAPYRERKVRLLNGAHTIMVPTALLCGAETVAEATDHEVLGAFLRQVLLSELLPSLDAPGAEEFADHVLDRFANPYIRHALIDITLQQTMKMRVRVVPSILAYAAKYGRAPRSVAFGFAAFLLYHRRAGDRHQAKPDDQADQLRALWRHTDGASPNALLRVAEDALSRQALWGVDLTRVPGFAAAVGEDLVTLSRLGPAAALEAHVASTAVRA
jgi:tagaturonate reductase